MGGGRSGSEGAGSEVFCLIGKFSSEIGDGVVFGEGFIFFHGGFNAVDWVQGASHLRNTFKLGCARGPGQGKSG